MTKQDRIEISNELGKKRVEKKTGEKVEYITSYIERCFEGVEWIVRIYQDKQGKKYEYHEMKRDRRYWFIV